MSDLGVDAATPTLAGLTGVDVHQKTNLSCRQSVGESSHSWHTVKDVVSVTHDYTDISFKSLCDVYKSILFHKHDSKSMGLFCTQNHVQAYAHWWRMHVRCDVTERRVVEDATFADDV